MADMYYRLVTLIVDVCPQPLRKLFLKYAEADFTKGQPFTIKAYIALRRQKLSQIKSLTRDQKNRLFHVRPIDIDDWDSSLLVLLLTELFESNTRPLLGHLKLIKEHRNTLQHFPSTEKIDFKQYNDIWDDLRDSTLEIAKNAVGEAYKNEMKDEIEKTSVNNMPNLGDVLRKWYSDKILCLESDVKILQNEMLDVSVGTEEANKILKSTSWDKHTRTTGVTSRRWKSVNPRVKHMQGSTQHNVQCSINDHHSNFLAQTKFYMKFKKDSMVCPQQSILRKAKRIFKTNKSLVITGKQKCGKTSLAMSLLEAYEECHCLILTEPEDVQYITFNETCVVVIEDFTGKHIFDRSLIEKWFRKFDILLAAVKKRQLNVIITCEETRFSQCFSEFKGHPLLEHMIRLETVQSKATPKSLMLRGKGPARTQYCIKTQEKPHGYLKEAATKGNKIHDICYSCDGIFLVGNSYNLLLLSSDLAISQEFNNVYCRMKFVISAESKAVYTLGNKITLYEMNDGKCNNASTVPLKSRALSASFFKKKIYVLDRMGILSIYNSSLQFERMFEIHLVNKDELVSSRIGIVALDDVLFLMKGYVYCIYYKENMIRYFSKENFMPLDLCRCDDYSIFVLGQSSKSSRSELWIYQLNPQMEILSKLVLGDMSDQRECLLDMKMVFDTQYNRLIILSNGVCSDVVNIKK